MILSYTSNIFHELEQFPCKKTLLFKTYKIHLCNWKFYQHYRKMAKSLTIMPQQIWQHFCYKNRITSVTMEMSQYIYMALLMTSVTIKMKPVIIEMRVSVYMALLMKSVTIEMSQCIHCLTDDISNHGNKSVYTWLN